MTTAEWFGVVPEGWHAVPLFGVASEKKVPNNGLRETNLLSLSYGRIVRKDIETNAGLLPASFETYQIVNPNDIVLRMTDLQNDQRSLRSARVEETGIITSAYLALNLRNVDPRFMAYQLRAIDLMKVFYSMGGGLRQSIGFGDLKRVSVLTPPIAKQQAIADYLDRETAQIDAFIAKNEELIALLAERRAAVIARAVTRGLDENAGMKESGIATLGLIPAHWSVNRIRNVGRAIIGLTYSPEDICDEDDPGTLVLRAGNIQNGELVFEDCVYVGKAIPKALRLQLGDIVICARNGSARLIGKNAVATSEVVGQTWGAFMAVLRTPINEYLRWVLNSAIFTSSIGTFATSTINQLTSSTLHSLQFAMPPKGEQAAISAYLTEATAATDSAVHAARHAVALARERRAALISAAVTGKIEIGAAA